MNFFLSDKQSIVNSNFDIKLCLTLFAFAYFNKTSSSFWFFFDIILTNLYGFSNGYPAGQCAILIVVVSILPHAEFGPNDHREDVPHFI